MKRVDIDDDEMKMKEIVINMGRDDDVLKTIETELEIITKMGRLEIDDNEDEMEMIVTKIKNSQSSGETKTRWR